MKDLNEDEIARYLRLSSDDEQVDETSIENLSSIDAAQLIWKETEGLRQDYQPPEVEASWQDLQRRKQNSVRHRKLLVLGSGIAASFLLFAFYFFVSLSAVEPMTISASNQPVLDRPLTDGSVLSLMANSEISFTAESDMRALFLSGGGFFEVAKDPDKPFVIQANDFQVEVLGTSFYVNDGTWGKPMVVVEEGLVNVRYGEHSVKISRGEAVMLNLLKGTYDRVMVTAHHYLSWKTGELSFDAAPIAEVIQILETHYQTELIYDSTSKALLTASFKDQPLDNIITLIQKTLDLNIQKIDD
ncbi:MAG: FecR domain-containing protein [Cytophagales bacterium]|nr:FecR domain-containing protein [Cytophagales bacterium]